MLGRDESTEAATSHKMSSSYKERLVRLGLFSPERMRLRGNFKEVYNIVSGINWMGRQSFSQGKGV